jgi:hypothetical protein
LIRRALKQIRQGAGQAGCDPNAVDVVFLAGLAIDDD